MSYKTAEWHDEHVPRFRSPDELHDVGVMNLLETLTSLAHKDYLRCRIIVLKEGDSTRRGQMAQNTVDEIVRFLLRGRFERLTNEDGEAVLAAWEREAKATAGRKHCRKNIRFQGEIHARTVTLWQCHECGGWFLSATAAYDHEQHCDGTPPPEIKSYKPPRKRKGRVRIKAPDAAYSNDWSVVERKEAPVTMKLPKSSHKLKMTPALREECKQNRPEWWESYEERHKRRARERWANLPPEVKKEYHRRDCERQKARIAAMTPEQKEAYRAKERERWRRYYYKKKAAEEAMKNADHGD